MDAERHIQIVKTVTVTEISDIMTAHHTRVSNILAGNNRGLITDKQAVMELTYANMDLEVLIFKLFGVS